MNNKKITAFALGPIVGAALGFATLPVITWFYSAEDIGRIAMLQVVISLVVMLFSLGLDQAYVREYHEVKNKTVLFKASIIPGLLLLLLLLSICLLVPALISDLLFKVDSQLISFLVALCLLCAFISRFLSLILRMQERGLAFSMSQVLPKLLFLVVIGGYVCFPLKYSLMDLVIAHTASFTMVTVVFAWNTRSEWKWILRETIDRQQLINMLRFGAPLILGGVTSWGMMVSDKLFLRNFSTFDELGIYSVAASFGAVAVIFQSIFSTVWVPTVYKWAAIGVKTDKIDQVTEGVLAVVVVLFAICGLLSWVIPLVLPIKYATVQYLVVACMASPLFYTLSETTAVGLGVSRKSSLSMLASVGAAVVSLIVNYLLVPRYGSAGAAIATAIAFWCFFFFRTELAIMAWRPLARKKLYILTLICLFLAILFAVFGSAYHSFFIFLWAVVLAFSLVFFRKLVNKLLVKIVAAGGLFCEVAATSKKLL